MSNLIRLAALSTMLVFASSNASDRVIYSITGPDGRTYSIDGPPGASREEVIGAIKYRLATENGSSNRPSAVPYPDSARDYPSQLSESRYLVPESVTNEWTVFGLLAFFAMLISIWSRK